MDFWVVFDAVIESMELKTFLHVMVKNILRLKKEKKKRKKKAKLILNENYISAEIALNWLECPQLAEIWSKVEHRLFPFQFAYQYKKFCLF